MLTRIYKTKLSSRGFVHDSGKIISLLLYIMVPILGNSIAINDGVAYKSDTCTK